MDKDAFVQFLYQYFGDFRIHSDCIDELVKILARGGLERGFLSQLQTRFKEIKAYDVNVHLHSPYFEKLTSAGKMYSMHINIKKLNIRVLYSYRQDNEVFLLAFFEKQGKRKTEYSSFIPAAQQRLQEMFS